MMTPGLWRFVACDESELIQNTNISGLFINSYKAWLCHDDVMKWKHFSHYWLFMREIRWSLVDSLHKGPVATGGLLVDSLHKGPGMWSFDVSFDVSLCKQLNKQSRCR